MLTSTKKLPRRAVHITKEAVRSSCLGAKLESGEKGTFAPSQYLAFSVG